MSTKLADTYTPVQYEHEETPADKRTPPLGQLLINLASSLALAVAVLAGTASLTGVVEGLDWFVALLLPVLVLHLVAGLCRSFRGLRWAAVPAALVVAVLAIKISESVQANDYGYPFIPWVQRLLGEAGLQLATQVPPVANSIYVGFSLLVFALAISLVVQVLASFRRLAMLVIIPLSLAPIVASMFKQEGAGIGYLALLLLALLGYIALIPYAFIAQTSTSSHTKLPTKSTFGVLGISAMACVGALLAAHLWMPGFRTGMFTEGQRPSGNLLASNVDPLLNLGRDLRSNSGAPLLSYYTTAEQAPYLRTDVIIDLEAERWEPSKDLHQFTYDGSTATQQNFNMFNSSVEQLRMVWPEKNNSPVLPLPDRSYFVSGIEGDWKWTQETSVARLSGDALSATGDINVAYSDLKISAEMVRNIGRIGIDSATSLSRDYRQLPLDPENTLEPLLKDTLREVYGESGTPRSDLDIAVALQQFFRSGDFVYSERTPLREGYDGANARVVEAFLERRQGYCVHFASAMALLARQAGIPSRIAVGYAPGKATGDTIEINDETAQSMAERELAEGTILTGYSVSGQQSHAWPELYLNGLGWVPFEPTPGRGYTPSYAPEPTSTAAAQESTAAEVPTERARPSTSASASASAQPQGAQSVSQGVGFGWIWPLLALLAILSLVITPVRRYRMRQRRLELIRQGGEAAAPALFAELQAIGADTGNPAEVGESVGDYLQRLSEKYPQISTDFESLKLSIHHSFYAEKHWSSEQSGSVLEALHRVRETLYATLPAAQKLAVRLFPASARPQHLRKDAVRKH